MEEAASRDGRKRRSIFEPASELSNKRRRTCPEECEWKTKVLALESTVNHLAAQVELLSTRLPASSTISIPTKDSTRYTCPASNCTKHFSNTDHLHRHIRSWDDEPHLYLIRILDQICCIRCNKPFKRPCDLVRHEKYHHKEEYASRVYKFASPQILPTPSDTSSNASADLDDIANETEQEDVEEKPNVLSDFSPRNINSSTVAPNWPSISFDVTSSTVQTFSNKNFDGSNSLVFDTAPVESEGYSRWDNNSSNGTWFIPPMIPTHGLALFDAAPLESEGGSHLDSNGSTETWFTPLTTSTHGSVFSNADPFGSDRFLHFDNSAGFIPNYIPFFDAALLDGFQVQGQT